MTDHPIERLVVVNSTEWRDLCARGWIRLLGQRSVALPPEPSPDEMQIAFALAPTTKLDSSVDLLVLRIRPDWPSRSDSHSVSSAVPILRLPDVLSHHVVAPEHLAYFQGLAAQCHVEISGDTFHRQWAHWVSSETARQAVESSIAVVSSVLGERFAPTKREQDELLRVALVASGVPGIDAEIPDLASQLVHLSKTIADPATGSRLNEKYYLVCAVEWVYAMYGIDPLETVGGRAVLRPALLSTERQDWNSPHRLSPAADAGLAYLEAAFPDAFDRTVTPLVVGLACRLLDEGRAGRLAPTVIRPSLTAVSTSTDSSAAQFLALIVALGLGPERTLQYLGSAGAAGRRTSKSSSDSLSL